MPNQKLLCDVCGTLTPLADLYPILLLHPTAPRLTGVCCPTCFHDVEEARHRRIHKLEYTPVEVLIDGTNYTVTRR